MRNLITYPVGLILKAYLAYAFILIEREKRKEQRAEKAIKKTGTTYRNRQITFTTCPPGYIHILRSAILH